MSFDFSKAYRVDGHDGIAWRATSHVEESVLVHDYYEDDDGSASYAEYEDVVNTSMVNAHMVGDDRNFVFDVDDLTPLEDDEYCGSCGQVGCGWH
jgi:hypothetical protein